MQPTEDSLPFRIACQIAVVLAILAAVSLEEGGWTWGLVAIGLSVFGATVSWRRRHAKNGWIKLGLAIGMMAAFWRFLGEAMYNPYDTRLSLAHLLVELQVLHSFDLPRRKDLYYSLLVSIALISVGATVSRTLGFGPWFLLWTAAILVSAGLGHLARFRVAASPQVWPLVRPFLLPVPLMLALAAAIWLVLPRYDGLRLQALPVSVRLPTPPGFTGQIANPSYPSPAQISGQAQLMRSGRLPFNPKAYYGFSYNLYLNYRGKLDDAIVLRVRSSIPSYWRGMAFDHYDGVSWSMSQPHKTQRYGSATPPIVVHHALEDDRRALTARRELIQTYYIETDQSNLIFAAADVESLYFPTSYVLQDRYGGLRSPVQLSKGMVYSVVSQIPRYEPMFLRRAKPLRPTPSWSPYLTVPDTVPERVVQLARRVTAQAGNAYDRMETLSRFLSTQYRYRLDIPPVAAGQDPIDVFLYEQKEGYCEQFASSLAIMGRSLGVPTRLVTGYTGGTLNRLTGYWEVKGSEAHAWVEAYFPAFGWVPFDPSPGFVAPLNPESPLDPLQRLGQQVAGWLMGLFGLTWEGLGALNLWALVGYAGVAASGAAALWLLWQSRRQGAGRRWDDRLDRIYWASRERARRQGVPDSAGTTPRRFAETAARRQPDAREAWLTLTALYERQHYAAAVAAAADVEQAKACGRQIADAGTVGGTGELTDER
jgi:transglutaminase-like putative cysteine protease